MEGRAARAAQGGVMADWSTLSAPQIRCIDALDFAVPLHWSHMHSRYNVRGPTIESCIRRGLVRREYLRAQGVIDAFAMPFLSLTQAGLAYQRDWRRWNAAVTKKVGEIFS